MNKKNINKKAAILATVLSGWMLGCSNVLAANLMAGVPSDYVNSQLGAITGSNVTTYVDATPAKGVVTDLNRDPAVFNVMVNGESKIFLRQYTYSTTSLKGSILFDSDGEWDSFDNPSGVIEQAPNAHGAAASGDYLYIADYDFGKIAVAKITETGLEEDTTKAIDLKQAIIEHCGAVFESEYAWVHGEGIIAKDGCLFVMVNVNPKGDYYNYVDSYLMQYAVNVDGSLKYVSHTRAGKNTDVVRMNIYNNMILTTAIGGMQNYGGTIADDKDSIVPGEGETIGNRDTCISIGIISGGKLKLEKKDVVVPDKVKDRGLDFRDIQILPNGTAYVMTYNLSGSGGGSTMRVYKTTVTNLLSQKPIDWEEIIDKTTIGNEDDKNGSGWFNQIYAEYYTKRVWAEIGDSLVVYTDGDATPKYTWLTKDFSTNEQLYKWNSLITVRPDEVTGDTALLVTYTPEGITSSSETVVRTVNENLQYQPGDYFISITGTDADKAYSSVTKDNSIYTFNSDKVIDLYFGDEGDKVNNVLAAIYANNGNDIIVNSGENDLQLQVENYISSPVGIFSGNGKDVTVNAGGLNILTYGYSGGNSLTNAIWLDPTQAGEGSININSDVNISMTGGYGGNGIAVQKTDRWGEASYTADNEAAIVINGDVAIKGVNSETWGIPINYENVFSRFNNAGILTSVEKSTVTVNGNVDFDVYGNGVTTNAKDSTVTINGGGKITVPSGMNYGYYSLASYLGTINMNTGANGNVPGSKDVQLNGDIFALNTGNINLALTTEASYLDGIVDNGGTVNLWLQNGATWINEANNTRYKQDNEDVGSGEQSSVTNLVGGNSKASAGVIHQTTNSKDLTIDNYSGYTKVLYSHDTSNPTNIYGGNVTIGSASNGSNITLITNYDANMNSTDVQNEVLNALANKLYYIGYTNGENNLTGTVAIAEGLTASSVYQYVGDIAYSSSTGQGRLDGTGKPAPVEPDIPTLDEDNAVVDKSAETWESNTSGENVQVEIKDDSTWKGDSKGDNLTANITNSTWEGNSTGAGLGANITNSTWKGDSTGAGAEVTLQDGGKWQGEHKGHDGKVNVGKDSEWIGSNYGDEAKVEVSEGAWHGENAGQKAEVTLTNGANWTGANTGDEATINVDGGIWEGANTGDDAQINMSGNASWKGNSEGKGAKITLGSKIRMRTFSLRSTGPVWEGDNSGEDTELVIGTGASWIGNNIGGNIKVEGDIDGLWQGDNAGTVTVDGITWNGNNLTNAIANVGSGAWVGNNFGTATFNGGSWTGNNVENGKVTVTADGWTGNNTGEAILEGGAWNGTNSGAVTMNNGTWGGMNAGTVTVNGGTWSGSNSGSATIHSGEWSGANLADGIATIEGGTWINDNAGDVTFNGGSWTGNNAVDGKVTIEADGWNGNNAGSVTLNNGTWDGSNSGTVTMTSGTWDGENAGTVAVNGGTWSGNNETQGDATIAGGTWTGINAGTATIEGGKWTNSNSGTVTFNGGSWSGDSTENGKVTVNANGWTGDNAGEVTITGGTWIGASSGSVILNQGTWGGINTGSATIKGGTWNGTNSGTVTMNSGIWSGDNSSVATIKGGEWTGVNIGEATIYGGVWSNNNSGTVSFNGGSWTGDNAGNGTVTVNATGWTGNNTGDAILEGGTWNGTNSGIVTLNNGTWGGNNSDAGSVTLNGGEWTGNNTGESATVSGTNGTWGGDNSGTITVNGITWEGNNLEGVTLSSGIWTGANSGTAIIEGGTWSNDNRGTVTFNGGNWTGNNAANGEVTIEADGWIGNNAGTVTLNKGTWDGTNSGTVDMFNGTWGGNNSDTGIVTLNGGAWSGDNEGTATIKGGTWTNNNAGIVTFNGGSWNGDNTANGEVTIEADGWIGNNEGAVSLNNGTWDGTNSGTVAMNSGTWGGKNSGTATVNGGTWPGNNEAQGNATIEGGTWKGANAGIAYFNGGKWTGDNTETGKVTVTADGWTGNNTGAGTVIVEGATWCGNNLGTNATLTFNEKASWTGDNSGANATVKLDSASNWTGDNSGANATVKLDSASNWTGTNTGANLNLTLDGASVWEGYSNVGGFSLNLNGNSVWKNTGASKVASFVGNNGVVDMSSANSGNITIDSYSGNVTVLYDHSVLDAAGTQVIVNGGNFTVTSAMDNSAITLVMGRAGLDLTEEDSINAALNALTAKLFYTNYAEEGNLAGTVKIAEGLTASSVSKQTANIVFGGEDGQGSVDKTTINPGPQYPTVQDKDTFTTAITGDAYDSDLQKEYRKFGVIQKDSANTYNFTYSETIITTDESTIDTVENVVLNLNGNSLKLVSGNGVPTILANDNITINGIGVLEANNGIKVADDKTVTIKLNGKESELKADVLASEGIVEIDLANGTWNGNNEGAATIKGGTWNGTNSGTVTISNGEWSGGNSGTVTLQDGNWSGDNFGATTLNGGKWTGKNTAEGEATIVEGTWSNDNSGTVNFNGGVWDNNNSGTVIFNGGSWTGNNVENGTVTVNATGWDGNNAGAGSVELKADWSGSNTANGSVTLNGGTWSGNNTGESAAVSGTNGKWTGDNRGTITVKGITWEGENLTEGSVTLDGGTWTGANSGIANIEGGKWTGTNAATTNLLAGEWTGVNTGTAIIKGGAWSNDNAGIVTFNGGSWTGNNAVKGKATIEADGWSGNNAGSVTLNDGTWNGNNSGTVNMFNGIWGGANFVTGTVTLNGGTWNGSNEGAATIKGGIWTGDNTGEATLENGEWSGDNLTTGIAIIEGGKWSGDNIGKVTLNKGTWEGINKGDANVTEVDWNKDNAGTVEINKGSWNGNNTGTATLTDVEWEGNNKNKVIVNNGSWVGSNESAGEATLSGGEWTGDNSGTVKMNGGTWSGNNEAQGNATIEGGTWKGANAGIAYFNGGKWTGDNTETGKVTVTADGWTGNNTGAGTVIVKGSSWDGNNLGAGANLTFDEKANWTGDNNGANLNLTLDGASIWEGSSNKEGFSLGLKGNSVWKNTGESKVASFVGDNGVVDMSAADSGNITIDSYSGNVTVLYDHGVSDEAGTQVTVNGGNFTVTSAMANSAITLVMGRDGLDLTEEDSINAALNALAAKLFYTNYAEEGNLAGTVKIAEGLTASSVSKQTASIVFGGEDGQGSVDKTTINPGPQYPTVQDKDTFTTGITGDYETDKEYRKSGVLTSNNGVYNFTKEVTNIADSNIGKDVVLNLNGNDLNISQEFRGNSNVGSGIVYGSVGLTTTNSEVTVDNARNINVDHRIVADNAKLTINNSGVLKVDSKVDNIGNYAAIRSVGKDAEIHINGSVEIDGNNDLLAIGAYDLGKTYVSNGTIVGGIVATDGGSVFVNNDNAENKVVITGDIEAKKDSKVTINFNTADSKLDGNVYGEGLVDLRFANESVWTGYSNAEGLVLALNNSAWNNTGSSNVQSVTANNGVVNMANANSGDVTIANYSGSMVVLYNHSVADDATSTMTGGKVVTVNGGNITIGSAVTGAEITLRTDRNGLNLESGIYTDKNLVNATLDALANKLFYTAYTTGETNLKGYVEIAEGLTASSVSKRVGGVSFDEVTGQGGYVYETAYPEEQVKDTFELVNALGSAEAEEALKEAGVLKNDRYEFTSDPTELKGNNVVVATEKDVVIDADGTLKLTAEETAIKAVGKDVTISAKNTIVTGQTGVDADDAQVKIDGSVSIEANKGIAVANGGKVTIDNAVIKSNIAANAVGGEVNIAKGNVTGAIHATNGAVVNLGSTVWTGDNIGDGADITLSDNVSWTGNNTGANAAITLNGESVWTGYSNTEGLALALNNSTWNNTGSSKVQSVTANKGVVDMTNANGDVIVANYSGSMVVLYSHSITDDATSTMTGGKVVTVNGGNITIGNAATGAEITLRTDHNGLTVGSDVYTDKNLVNATLDALANKLFYTAYTTGETNLKGYVEIAEGLTASSVSKRVECVSFDKVTGQGGYAYETVYPEEQVKDTFELENALGSAEAEEALKEAGVLKNDRYEFTSDPTVLNGENVVVADGKDVTITAEGALELCAGNIAVGAANNKVDVEAKDLGIKGNVIAIGGGVVDVNATGKLVLDGDIQVDSNSVVTVKFSGADSKFTGNIAQYDGVALLNSGFSENGVSLEFTNKASWEGWNTSDNFQISLDDSAWHNTDTSKAQSITAKKGVIYMDGENAAMDVANFSGDLTVVYDRDDEGNILGEAFVLKQASKVNEKTNSSITLFTEKGNIEVKKDNEAEIRNVFEQLADKLQYKDYIANEGVDEQGNPINNYLDGYVKMAEGITGTGATADIVFGADNTIGNIKIGPEINYGAYETAMMKGAKSAMTSSAMMWRAEANDLMKRMGDLRMAEGEYGIWAKYYGTKQEMEAQNTKYTNSYKAYQLGFDKKVGDWTVGVAASYGDGESTYASGRGENSVVSLGMYGAWNGEDGQYVDVIMKRSKLDNEYELNGDVTIGRLEADYETWATSISAEYGKRIETNKGFYVEPSVEFTLGRVDGASYNTSFSLGGQRLNVQQDDYDTLIGRLGLRLGQKLDKASYYAKFAVAKEFCGDYDTKYATLTGSGLTDSKETYMSFKDTWYEMQIGGTAQLSDNSYIYASYERNFGADVEQKWRIDAGLRWTF